MSYCNNCGEVLKEGSKFCTYCGHPVGEPVVSQPVQSPAYVSSSQPKGKIIMKGTGMTTLYKVIAYFVGVFIFDLFLSWAITAGFKGPISMYWALVGILYVPLLIFTPLLIEIASSY
ncbi:MAG: zinc-ribbon domain-containing protein [Promethearchaeota archaeon]